MSRFVVDANIMLAALAGRAGAIITGDRDLLDHKGLEPPAVDARRACELVRLLEPR